jgi:hypothetical protein
VDDEEVRNELLKRAADKLREAKSFTILHRWLLSDELFAATEAVSTHIATALRETFGNPPKAYDDEAFEKKATPAFSAMAERIRLELSPRDFTGGG